MSNYYKLIFFYGIFSTLMLMFLWYQRFEFWTFDPVSPPTSTRSNRDMIILFWNKFWVHEWFNIGKGSLPYKKCLNQNCFNTRNRSLLHDPHIIVDAIIFHGVQIPLKDFEEIRKFRDNLHLVQMKNQGIKPKIVLFLVVSN